MSNAPLRQLSALGSFKLGLKAAKDHLSVANLPLKVLLPGLSISLPITCHQSQSDSPHLVILDGLSCLDHIGGYLSGNLLEDLDLYERLLRVEIQNERDGENDFKVQITAA